ncbi:DgyrCDS11686 [Dimorphilus gyrociliatus]|uniref:DgyrCDS11686 n=1 Tax=Dimorphilus gyrociliatus TaxID=2664684 RepID=A0A7I8W5F7_9ANNE|nr:DgyrCDS11686 [Dimorphilus gyrociliatus]
MNESTRKDDDDQGFNHFGEYFDPKAESDLDPYLMPGSSLPSVAAPPLQPSHGGVVKPEAPEQRRPKGRPAKGESASRFGSVQCAVCSKRFNNSSALAKHKLTHSDERKHVCNICSKAFKRQDHLNGHMMTHRSKKPFACKVEGCDKSYCDARSLRRHMENTHQPEPMGGKIFDFDPVYRAAYEKSWTGSSIDGSLQQQYSPITPTSPIPNKPPPPLWAVHGVEEHMTVECKECHRRFKNVAALNGHMRLHGGYYKKETPSANTNTNANTNTTRNNPIPIPIPNPIPKPQEQPKSFVIPQQPKTIPAVEENNIMSTALPVQINTSTLNVHNRNAEEYDPRRHTVAMPNLTEQKPIIPAVSTSCWTYPAPDVTVSQSVIQQISTPYTQAPLPPVSNIHLKAEPLTPNQLPISPKSMPATPLGRKNHFTFPTPNDCGQINDSMDEFGEHVGDDDVFATQSTLTSAVCTSMAQAADRKRRMSADPDKYTMPKRPYVTKDSIVKLLQQAGMEEVLEKLGYEVDTGGGDQPLPVDDSIVNHIPPPFVQFNSSANVALEQIESTLSINDTIMPHYPAPMSVQGGILPNNNNNSTVTNNNNNNTNTNSSISGNVTTLQRGDFIFDSQPLVENKSSTTSTTLDTSANVNTHNSSRESSVSTVNRQPERLKDDFRNPQLPNSTTTLAHKKKKPRPEPLVIPSAVNQTYGYYSQLRSPRIREGPFELTNNKQPPPYTPPPILSPARYGSGLFWTVRRPAKKRPSPPDSPDSCDTEMEDEEPPPETDVMPHVNIGPRYQAQIPKVQSYKYREERVSSPETLVWSVDSRTELSEDQLLKYEDVACSAAIPGKGTNKEYALHVLHAAHGDVQTAMMLLLTGDLQAVEDKFRKRVKTDLIFNETDIWNRDEIESFTSSMTRYDKDFVTISKDVGTKCVQQCVQFYYLWKKVCVDDYKRMRVLRKRRLQDEMYNYRTRGGSVSPFSQDSVSSTAQDKPYFCEYGNCNMTFSSQHALNIHLKSHTTSNPPSRSTTPNPDRGMSPASDIGQAEACYPCKVCGKIFTKVKSRSAHMKSHRQGVEVIATPPRYYSFSRLTHDERS